MYFFLSAYADDLQVYCHMNVGSEQVMLQRFSECADSVSRWMSSNRLKLNPSKTELIWFYSGRRQLSFIENDIMLFGNRIAPVHTAPPPPRELLPCSGGGLNALMNGLTKSTRPVSGFHYSPFPLGKRAACLPWAATCVGGLWDPGD